MREIKFRGKSMGGHWIFGLLTKKKIRNSGKLSFAIATDDYSLANTIPVAEETIGEFTGCRDKNGVEIYDGDILINPLVENESYVVYRTAGGWCIGDPELVETMQIHDSGFDDLDTTSYEVVGNIFDR